MGRNARSSRAQRKHRRETPARCRGPGDAGSVHHRRSRNSTVLAACSLHFTVCSTHDLKCFLDSGWTFVVISLVKPPRSDACTDAVPAMILRSKQAASSGAPTHQRPAYHDRGACGSSKCLAVVANIFIVYG